MKSHELLREVFQDRNPKQVAEEMGVSLSLVYKWAEDDTGGGSGALNPLDRVEALWRATGDERIVEWLCGQAGGFFVKNAIGTRGQSFHLVPATNQVVQEFAMMLSVVARAALDNSINAAEAEQIRSRWEKLKSVTEGFVRGCEQGNFGAITGARDVA